MVCANNVNMLGLRQRVMKLPQVADRGDGLHIWRVAVNILNKQSLTAGKWLPSSFGVGRWASNSST
jgi:hypothetical protein